MTTTGLANKRQRKDEMMMKSVTTDDEKTIEVKKKTMYVRVAKNEDFMFPTWFVIDPCSPSNSLVVANRMMEYMPIHLRNISYYANAFWKSRWKMFFIGGVIWDQEDPHVYILPHEYKFSDKVFAFDVEKQTWDDDEAYPSMHSARAASLAEVADDKLFVFGPTSQDRTSKDDNHFAEYLDLSEQCGLRQWKCIPSPPKQMCEFSPVRSIAYYQPGNLFIFWVSPDGAFFTLNLSTLTWLTVDVVFPNYPQSLLDPSNIYSTHAPLHFGPFWSNRVVVMFNALFWHYGCTIYAVDFTNQQYFPRKLCTFDNPYFKSYAEASPSGDDFRPTFLVSQTEGTLCLVWSKYVQSQPFLQYSFYFLNFTVQRQSNATLLVHLEQPHPLEASNASFLDIQDVLLV